MSLPILETKLFIPRPHDIGVARTSLIEKLHKHQAGKLTLISAPAGFGKTTLLAAYLRTLKKPASWISLDELDNDKIRFLKYFILALQKVKKGIGDNSLMVLQSQHPFETEHLLTRLTNEIAEIEQSFVVVLDDFHVITEPEIQKILLFLLDSHLSQMRLIVSGRADPPWPLARLRARGEIMEIRAQDLKFSLDDVATFFNDVMALELAPEEITALEQRTEGWVAGMQMAAISLQEQQDKNHFIQSFTGSHRYVMDFLIEEVLNQVPVFIRDFLLKTSILDHFNAPLCDFLVEGDNSHSILRDIEKRNLFLIPLDDHRNWYRYHHLFAELLRNQIRLEDAKMLPNLHRRASIWFEQNSFVETAIAHAIAAKDLDLAASIVENNVIAIKDSGSLNGIVKWLQKFPDEMIFTRPWLCIAKAWVLIYLGKMEEAVCILDEAELSITDEKRDFARGHIAAIRCYYYLFQGDLPKSIEQGYNALKQIEKTDISTRISAATTLASAQRLYGDLENAHSVLLDAITLSKKGNYPETTVRLLCGLSALQIFKGQLSLAYSTLQEAIRVGQWSDDGKPTQPLAVLGLAHVRMAQILKSKNQLGDALGHVQIGINLCKQWGQANALWEGYLNLAEIQNARGVTKDAQIAFLEAEKTSNNISTHYVEMITAAQKAQFWLDAGQVDLAADWAWKNELQSDKTLNYINLGQYDIFANVLIAQKKYAEAKFLLKRMIELTEKSGALGLSLSYKIRLSIIYAQQGLNEQALDTFCQALLLGQSFEDKRVFIEQGESLLGLLYKSSHRCNQNEFIAELIQAIEDEMAKKAPEKAPAKNLVEPLSQREVEVLRYLNSELTIADISSQLHIAISTLRSHIRNIYEKLGVHSRFEAIAKGKEMELI